jgi:tetratricopeptide (TPR) repeat protein
MGEAAEARFRELTSEGYVDSSLAEIDQALGDDEAVAERLRRYLEYETARGGTALLGTYGPMRALALCRLGRYDEAERVVAESEGLAPDDDPVGRSLWHQAAALVRSKNGAHPEAEELARAGVALVLTTDSLPVQGEAQLHLAEVLEAAEKRTEAALALDEALKTFEAKGIVPLAQRARERLAALQEGSGAVQDA